MRAARASDSSTDPPRFMVMMVMVCAMAVIVVVLQVLRYIAHHLLGGRRGFARPFDAAALFRRLAQILEREARRILCHLEPLGEGGEHQLSHLAAVPALAVRRELTNLAHIARERRERRPLHRE